MVEEFLPDHEHKSDAPDQPVQTMDQPKPLLKRYKQFEKILKRVSSNAVRLALLLLVIIVVVVMIKDIRNSNFFIEEVSVPEDFQQAGYSGSVMSDRIFYQLKQIIERERMSDRAAEYEEANRGIDVNVEVVGIGIPVRSMTSLLSQSLDLGNSRMISANITTDGDTAILNLMIEGQMENRSVIKTAGLEKLVNDISLEAARMILKYSDPYTLTRHFLLRDGGRLHELGNYILTRYRHNQKVEPLGYYAVAGGYASDGNFDAMEKIVREAMTKYPNDVNLNAALGSCLYWQGKHEAARTQELKMVSMIGKNTPINRVALTYFNLGNLMEDMGKRDSSRYYVLKAISVDEDYADAYMAMAYSYLQDKDTITCMKWIQKGLYVGFPINDLWKEFEALRNHPEMRAMRERYKHR